LDELILQIGLLFEHRKDEFESRAAKADDRSVSSYVRRLIAADLVRTASLMHQQHDSGEAVQGGDERASAGRGGAAG
jgi:hypothetical protein